MQKHDLCLQLMLLLFEKNSKGLEFIWNDIFIKNNSIHLCIIV
jgi:hypothetical protein